MLQSRSLSNRQRLRHVVRHALALRGPGQDEIIRWITEGNDGLHTRKVQCHRLPSSNAPRRRCGSLTCSQKSAGTVGVADGWICNAGQLNTTSALLFLFWDATISQPQRMVGFGSRGWSALAGVKCHAQGARLDYLNRQIVSSSTDR